MRTINTEGYQERYVAYAISQGKTPSEMAAHNKKTRTNHEFIAWIADKKTEFKGIEPGAFAGECIIDQDAFTEFLFK